MSDPSGREPAELAEEVVEVFDSASSKCSHLLNVALLSSCLVNDRSLHIRVCSNVICVAA